MDFDPRSPVLVLEFCICFTESNFKHQALARAVIELGPHDEKRPRSSAMASSNVALVTGGASGIGLALTKHLLQRGFRVVVADLNGKRGAELQQELGSEFLFVECDVTDWNAQAKLFRKAYDWAGQIDFLAANAGIASIEPVYELSMNESGELEKPNLATIEVDLLAVFYGLTLFRHYHQKREDGGEGKIVVTASQSGLYPLHFRPTYSAAKHGVSLQVKSILLQIPEKST